MITYKSGYKHQLSRDVCFQTDIRLLYPISTEWLTLTANGLLYIKRGYAWDGPSGEIKLLGIINIDVTKDDETSMQGSLVHDALYQLIRLGLLSINYRKDADKLLRDICISDGMYELKANAWYKVVRKVATFAAEFESEPKEIICGNDYFCIKLEQTSL